MFTNLNEDKSDKIDNKKKDNVNEKVIKIGEQSKKLSTMAIRLKELRKQRDKEDFNNKWTQQFVANQLGISRSAYALYENGENNPSIEILIKLCDLYGGISLDYIMGIRDEQSVSTDILVDPNIKKIVSLIHRLPDEKKEKFLYMLYGILLNEELDE
ncbi:MAG: helix-turn-helix transcriptional regulator [Bacillota bacterium]|nr:helix-turn-helix transcriptional regulator [Bacillota bacterium]